jgi:hypothetical protein
MAVDSSMRPAVGAQAGNVTASMLSNMILFNCLVHMEFDSGMMGHNPSATVR